MSKKIAVIEDNKTNIKLIRYQLEMEGFDVHIEETGNAGLKMIKNQKPDMVILDIGLPDMDGFELCKTLRNDKITIRPIAGTRPRGLNVKKDLFYVLVWTQILKKYLN